MILLASTMETLNKGFSESTAEQRLAAVNDFLKALKHGELNTIQIDFISNVITEIPQKELEDRHINFLNWLSVRERNRKEATEAALRQQRNSLSEKIYTQAKAEKNANERAIREALKLIQGIDHDVNGDRDFMIAFIPIDNGHNKNDVLDDVLVQRIIREALLAHAPASCNHPLVVSLKGAYTKDDTGIDTRVNERALNYFGYKSVFVNILNSIQRNLFTHRYGRIFPEYIRFKTGIRSSVIK